MAPLNVAVIGAGPAGIYASDILSKSGLEVNIDLFERLPAPYGLVRYGVAPDHPRIKRSSSPCTRSSSVATFACSATLRWAAT